MIDKEQQSSPSLRGKRLRLLRRMSGLTLGDFAKKYHLGVSTVKCWECAKNRGLSSKGARKLVTEIQHQGIQCSYTWLMHGVGLPPQFFDVCFHDGAKISSNIGQTTYEEEESIIQEISFFCERIIDAITLTVFDDGMEPIYFVGDSIGGKRLYGDDLVKSVGKNCIIETGDRQLLCRRVAPGNDIDSFNLYCINPYTLANPPHIYNIRLLSAAPISRVWKRLS